MPACLQFVAKLFVSALLAAGLAGCAAVNEKVSAGMGDYIPQWAGGLPRDAPPRPGTPEYDQFMKDRERRRQTPAAERDKQTQSNVGPQAATPTQ